MLVIVFIGAGIAVMINTAAGMILVLTAALLIGAAVLFTIRRYKDIEKLSGYLRKIYGGDYTLDIRDNEEGELSILKNEIYKVTLILSQQAQLLQKEKEQLADAISDISHQLKTPLTSMLVMTDLLHNDELDPEKRMEFTKNLGLQLNRMEWLMSSLLKLSKIEAGAVRFKKERVMVTELINHSAKPLLIPMELKQQRFITDGNTEVSFNGDFNWTAEALINIMKNCVEHTPEGGTISVFFEENPMYTQIIISDNGCGIEKEDLPFIFKRFYKGKNANEDSVGIGLAMAKSIINGQNGDITVTSFKNQGSKFYVKLYKQVT
jgi:signal transduction histidine kinase